MSSSGKDSSCEIPEIDSQAAQFLRWSPPPSPGSDGAPVPLSLPLVVSPPLRLCDDVCGADDDIVLKIRRGFTGGHYS